MSEQKTDEERVAGATDEDLAVAKSVIDVEVTRRAESKHGEWLREDWAKCVDCAWVFTNAMRDWVACPKCGRAEKPVAELIK